MTYNIPDFLDRFQELYSEQTPFVVVTLIGIRGSAPQVVGAKAIVSSDGILAGTVGGGKVEARAIAHAISLLSDSSGIQNDLTTWNLQTDIKMTCGGEVTFFFEVVVGNEWRIALFGAGHVAQAVLPILLNLNCRICWLDQRDEWLAKTPDHPRLTKICRPNLVAEVKRLSDSSFFVLMTQGHATDLPVLTEILRTKSPPYLGVLGSQQKASKLRRDLEEKGFEKSKIDSFECPMGLPIGNNSPPEMAISIVSQLLQKRDELGIVKQKCKKF